MTSASGLLLRIARCENIKVCRAHAGAACHTIVALQPQIPEQFQVPEPWSGQIETAPILFLSSNPSISDLSDDGEDYPTWDWSDAQISDFFDNRFDGGRKSWIVDGIRARTRRGDLPKQWVRYWASVRQRASELLPDHAVRPGIDYCLSEVVHCKSEDEVGVESAFPECTNRYLGPMLEAAAAIVIVCLGTYAGRAVRALTGSPESNRFVGPISLCGRDRFACFLPHPNARGVSKGFVSWLADDELERVRRALRLRIVA